ncbi:hypothetical protein A6E00_08240 [Vibrio diabolicus]|uniref:Uncharacterized protein n=1 Tax=Vibrio sp. FF_273 TaxID=1652830 RepID=A0A0H3ZX17_9VIBR|nr:hypothetical protein [Vibrio sp. FF_273]OCH70521.1 hypothetical protein A6E00_08240 [Vibrio diabolicus]
MIKEQQKKGALAYYWDHLDSKIRNANTLEELIKYRRKIIKTSGTLTYKTPNGYLTPHHYNKGE